MKTQDDSIAARAMPALNRYLEVSGADKGEPYVSRVCELIAHLPELADDDRIALLQIKNALFEAGFRYDQDTFLAQDVITKRRGNCLGLPLFMGVLFADLRRPPGFGILTSILDGGFDDENEVILPRILEATRYDNPQLATQWEENLFYRFHPLQHIVLCVDDGPDVEATMGGDDIAPPAERQDSISLDQALGCVLKDRAEQAFQAKNLEDCRRLAQHSLRLWSNNRELISLLAELSYYEMLDKEYEKWVARYQDIGGEDSLYHLTRHDYLYAEEDLKMAMSKYPACAEARVQKAIRELDQPDRRDARFSFAIASQLVAMSCLPEPDLADFYGRNPLSLACAYDSESIGDILARFEDYRWGDFDYHLACYLLTGSREHRAETREAAQTAYDWVRLCLAVDHRGEKLPAAIEEMAAPHLHKKLMTKVRRDMFLQEGVKA